MPDFRALIDAIARTLECGGVLLIFVGVLFATAQFLRRRHDPENTPYRQYRRDMGRSILLGLEVLVAADIIATVTISPTLESVLILAIIVAVRTFLSISIEIDVEGRLPWRRDHDRRTP